MSTRRCSWSLTLAAGYCAASVMLSGANADARPGALGPRAQAPTSQQTQDSPAAERLALTAGLSKVITTDFDITRIAVTNPAVADAVAVQPREVLVDGKAAGTISLIIWGATQRKHYEVVVEPAITTLQQRLQTLFPGEDIQVTTNEEALVLSGHASSTAVMLKAAEIAQASSSKAKVINMLRLPGGMVSQQVMLQVRFAEVSRSAARELGASFFTTPEGFHNNVMRSTTQQFAAPGYDEDKLTFSDYLNLFVLNTKYDVGAVIRALKSKGYFQSLAEPNLIAYNGKEASFLAGGEFPVPVVQGGMGNNAVTIQWREFGVRLRFTPTIAGDVIRLHVRPEVSTLDFQNGITLSGFTIPALSSRWAETEVELRDGQSFAIAGLLNNISQDNHTAIPFLSSIPIIGNLFKGKAETAERTELMVLITPQLVRALEPDEVPPLPTNPKGFLGEPGQPGQSPLADGPVPAQADKPKKSPGDSGK